MDSTFELSKSLRNWYRIHYRELPWRKTKDPYLIWLSEIILQQTRVQQGLPYYTKFSTLFPDIQSFAGAGEEVILKVWQGLGYYSRARNMLRTAQIVLRQNDGEFPNTFEKLKLLPGIGDYTAAAIASFAFDVPVAVVDGNVKRVLSRLFAVHATDREFQKLANEILPPGNAAEHNQAMMELGALICTPQNPSCERCPLYDHCTSGPAGKWTSFPAKTEKTKQKIRYFNYWVPLFHQHTLIRRRGPGDVWQGLHEFHLFESDAQLNHSAELLGKLPKEFNPGIHSGTYLGKSQFRHILSHQIIHATFHIWKYPTPISPISDGLIVAIDEINIKFACSRLMDKFLRSQEFKEYVS